MTGFVQNAGRLTPHPPLHFLWRGGVKVIKNYPIYPHQSGKFAGEDNK